MIGSADKPDRHAAGNASTPGPKRWADFTDELKMAAFQPIDLRLLPLSKVKIYLSKTDAVRVGSK